MTNPNYACGHTQDEHGPSATICDVDGCSCVHFEEAEPPAHTCWRNLCDPPTSERRCDGCQAERR